MGITSRLQSLGTSDITKGNNNAPTANHDEEVQPKPTWAGGKEGDVAQALFNNTDEINEEIDPAEVRRVLWKIDFMILPYLAVCYAFFYIDKVGFYFSSRLLFGMGWVANYGTDHAELRGHLWNCRGLGTPWNAV